MASVAADAGTNTPGPAGGFSAGSTGGSLQASAGKVAAMGYTIPNLRPTRNAQQQARGGSAETREALMPRQDRSLDLDVDLWTGGSRRR